MAILQQAIGVQGVEDEHPQGQQQDCRNAHDLLDLPWKEHLLQGGMTALGPEYGRSMSDELLQEVQRDVRANAGSVPVDMANPTFGSLLTLVQQVRAGKAGDAELEAYDRALTFKLQLARTQLDNYEMPDGLRVLAGPAIGLAIGLMTRMEDTLVLLRQYRRAPSPAMLDEAEGRLKRVHATMRTAFSTFANPPRPPEGQAKE